MLEYIYPEATLPLGLPAVVSEAAWSGVYTNMALWGVISGVAGAGGAYALAPKKKKGRYAAYTGLGCAGLAAGLVLFIGWRRIKAADAIWSTYSQTPSDGGAITG